MRIVPVYKKYRHNILGALLNYCTIRYILFGERHSKFLNVRNNFVYDVLAKYGCIHYAESVACDNDIVVCSSGPLSHESLSIVQHQRSEEVTVGVAGDENGCLLSFVS